MSLDGLMFFLQFCSVKVFAFEGIMFKPWHQEACRKGQLNCGEEESDTSSEYPHNIPQFLRGRLMEKSISNVH
jgi:hypothetical protein